MRTEQRLTRLEQRAPAEVDRQIEIHHIRWASDNQIEVSIEKRERRPDDIDGQISVIWGDEEPPA